MPTSEGTEIVELNKILGRQKLCVLSNAIFINYYSIHWLIIFHYYRCIQQSETSIDLKCSCLAK